jgi:hypothetical protein
MDSNNIVQYIFAFFLVCSLTLLLRPAVLDKLTTNLDPSFIVIGRVGSKFITALLLKYNLTRK